MLRGTAFALAGQIVYGPDPSKEQVLEKFFSRKHADDPAERFDLSQGRQNLILQKGLYSNMLSNSGASR
jgi:hypothetical protein